MPFAGGVPEHGYEADGEVGAALIVAAGGEHERRGFVFKVGHEGHLQEIKKDFR